MSCTPFEKALSWLGYAIVEGMWERENHLNGGTFKEHELIGRRMLEILADPPGESCTSFIARSTCTKASRIAFNHAATAGQSYPEPQKQELFNRAFKAIIEDPLHSEHEATMAAEGLQEPENDRKLEILFELSREQEVRAELMEMRGGLDAVPGCVSSAGPDSEELCIDEEAGIISIGDMSLKINAGTP